MHAPTPIEAYFPPHSSIVRLRSRVWDTHTPSSSYLTSRRRHTTDPGLECHWWLLCRQIKVVSEWNIIYSTPLYPFSPASSPLPSPSSFFLFSSFSFQSPPPPPPLPPILHPQATCGDILSPGREPGKASPVLLHAWGLQRAGETGKLPARKQPTAHRKLQHQECIMMLYLLWREATNKSPTKMVSSFTTGYIHVQCIAISRSCTFK